METGTDDQTQHKCECCGFEWIDHVPDAIRPVMCARCRANPQSLQVRNFREGIPPCPATN